MDFKEWFCLNQRESFTIDPKINSEDAQFYFGRKQIEARMCKQITRSFIDPQVPKMMIYGPYGCGKTQTLYYLDYWLNNFKPASCKLKPNVVHLDIEMQSKSTALSWHLQNMEAVRMQTVQKWIDTLYNNSQNFKTAISNLTKDPNIASSFENLRGGGERGFQAWRWLGGQKLSAKELQELKLTRNLGEVGVGDLISALISTGNLAKEVGECLIIFIDEMEELQNVREGDAAESWHQYARKLSDNANSSVGFIIGFKADTLDDAPRMLIRDDIRSRLSMANIVELDTLAAPANVKQFVEEMLAKLINQSDAEKLIQSDSLPSTKKTYPFTASAFDLLCDYACQDAVKSTPRNIIRTINECAIAAWDAKEKTISDNIVNEIAPIIFG